MCRNIRPLANFEPPVTSDEIQAAAGRATGTVWTQVVGQFNEIVIETDHPDLSAYERAAQKRTLQ